MYVHSVRLTNFRSIGDYPEAEIHIEPQITALIGKNESGKSNVLEGLSLINLRANNQAAFSDAAKSRIQRNAPIGYTIILKPTLAEIREFGIEKDSTICITASSYSAEGGIKDYFYRYAASACCSLVTELKKLGNNPFKLSQQDQADYQHHLAVLSDSEHLDIYALNRAFASIERLLNSISAEARAAAQQMHTIAKEQLQHVKSLLPIFYLRKPSRHLQERYTHENVAKELAKPQDYSDSLLFAFVKILGIEKDDFIRAVSPGMNADQFPLRKKLSRLVEEKINIPLRDFYRTEDVSLDVDFNAGFIFFLVRSSNGESLQLSERSSGLKWFIDTFIDMLAQDIPARNAVFLLDEPGTSLHINAQRELLNLFRRIADTGNQVVYTTHSPSMLDTDNDGLHRIRAIVKDAAGFTRIYKTAYDSRIAPQDQHDTLAPVINAIGMNLSCVFGPGQNRINIIPEGMSDYIYLVTMGKIIGLDWKRYTIIPTVGASNAINICAILRGWGCPFIAVFDYDEAGVESGGEKLRKNFDFNMNSEYCYLADVGIADIQSQTYHSNGVVIEDVVGREEIQRYYSESKRSPVSSKTLLAKLVCNASDAGTFSFSPEAVERFRMLFSRIISYTNK